MTEPTTYKTAGGAVVTLGSRINAFKQPTYTYECDGCDGIAGFKTADVAEEEAEKHAKRCTDRPGSGGAR